jgi:hypothetical protein
MPEDVAEGKTEEVAKGMTKAVTKRTLKEVAKGNDGRGGDRRDGCSAE